MCEASSGWRSRSGADTLALDATPRAGKGSAARHNSAGLSGIALEMNGSIDDGSFGHGVRDGNFSGKDASLERQPFFMELLEFAGSIALRLRFLHFQLCDFFLQCR